MEDAPAQLGQGPALVAQHIPQVPAVPGELPLTPTPLLESANEAQPPETSAGSQPKADAKSRPPSVRCAQHRLCCNFSHKSKRARQFEIGSSKARECETCHKWLCSDVCLQNHKACKGSFVDYPGASQEADACLYKAHENVSGAWPPRGTLHTPCVTALCLL